MRKCLRCSQGLTLGWAGGKTRNGPKRRLGRYKNRNGRNERPVDGSKANSSIWFADARTSYFFTATLLSELSKISVSTRPRICFGCSMP